MSRTWSPWQAVLLVVVVTGLVVAGLAAVGTSAPDRQHSTIQSHAEGPATNAGLGRGTTNLTSHTTDAAWTQARANAANTNYINTTGPTNPITVRWRFETDADTYTGSPLVTNNTVYFVTQYYGQEEGKGKLYAVDAWTGDRRWTFERPASFGNKLAVLRNTIYVGTHNGRVYALNTATGERFWTFVTDGRPTGLTVANHTLYVTTWNGHIYALGALRGEEKWAFNTDGPTAGPAAVKGDTVYVTARRRGGLYALDARTGTVRWNTIGGILRPPVVANGIVYVGTAGGKGEQDLIAFDADRGDQLWRRHFQQAGHGLAPPSVFGSTAYVSGKFLHAIDPTTGTDRWTVRELKGTPLLTDDLGYVRAGGADGALYTLNLTTGEYDARFTPAPFNNSWDRWHIGMAVVNGSLYTGVGIDTPTTRYRSERTIFYALGTPKFNYTNLSVTPTNPDVNETVNATVTVRNTGTGPGEFNAVLLVNDNVSNTTTARLDARTNTTVQFPLVFQTNGTYTVGIHNLTRTITVGEVTSVRSPTTRVTAASPTRDVKASPTTTPIRRDETQTATPTSAPTPGFGMAVWLVALVIFVAVLTARRWV